MGSVLRCAVVVTAALLCVPAIASAQGGDRVLVFTGTEGTAHPTTRGVDAIRSVAADAGLAVDATDDAGAFTAENLARYRAVVFLSTAGDVLSDAQEAAFQAYVRASGGFLGIHDAARLEPAKEWFTGLVGARPAPSPSAPQRAVVEVGDRLHPATKELPLTWTRTDEWFNWEPSPSGTVHTVARVRERSYAPGAGADGWDHPIAWCRDYDGGRSFYTAMGHTAASWDEARFREHLAGALRWTAGLVRADCKATIAANYEATRLTPPNQPGQLDQTGEPHGLAIADDGQVFYNGRAGRWDDAPVVLDWNDPDVGRGYGTIHVWDPETATVTPVATLDVFGNRGGGDELVKSEEGALGIELDPDFLSNGWMYVYWMPHDTIDRVKQVGKRRISRFTYDFESKTLDLGSEAVLLEWTTQIHSCCHAGGGMTWDSKGNLYVATGDSNSSQGSEGYSGNNPTEEFAGLSFQDARRTAGNTNDLNGKILRIRPRDDGSYTIPKGNLFTGREEGGGKTRPEIYVMGVRNPARIWVDPVTDWLLAAWVGPDAGTPNLTWGPAKYENIAAIKTAGNQGWPYCMGNKQPYRDRNFPDPEEPLEWYDCDNPRNESPHNTGLVDLPPVRANTMWYSPQGGGPVFAEHPNGVPIYDETEQTLTQPYFVPGGAQAVMTGPIYRYDAGSASTTKWPRYWDGKWLLGDFYADRSRLAVLLDPKQAAQGVLKPPVHAENLAGIVPAGDEQIDNLMAWRFGPDGALYVLNYGSGFFTITDDSALWRVTYKGGGPTPTRRQQAAIAARVDGAAAE